MSIDINGINQRPTVNSNPSTKSDTAADSSNDKVAKLVGNAGNTVELTSEAKNLQRVQASLSEVSDVNHAKVASLKQAISEGRYQIDAERLADNMLALETEIHSEGN